MTRAAILAFLLLSPCLAAAQVRPVPGTGNPHIQSVDYRPDQVVWLEAAPGYQVTIELAPDERVENVALGDSGAWQVTANRRGDRLFVKPIRTGVSTNMLVVTDSRRYNFELSSLAEAGPATAWSIKFRYPALLSDQAPGAAGPEKVVGRYKVRGSPELRPSGIHDDGIHTYVEWPEDRPLPAIYAVNGRGRETLINGMMRDGRIVIDSIQDRLVFRIDNGSAEAVRVVDRR
ncbi:MULTISPECIES: TrbG/VirB9 family P-type conjugative transfer protein [unclassified Sphingomonas]|uniref:TrbG/VirB9 family P-type conjugative transfer protein n=1 Tax=unclassified Sphingomonas TaxID=196159 RepID=UPI0024579483|nr:MULTISPECIES: TrbG/VirB9 family P-type conjugative transfer protein [unclassified Sphingomonas]MDH4744306.1 TrbG/VirB9 family P-type conjugative transfer protein [Sphingomonas sp. CBMAI 2297]